MATKICLSLAADVEKAYLEQIYQQAIRTLKQEQANLTSDYEISYNKEMLQRLTSSQKVFLSSLPILCDFEAASFLFGTGEGVMYLSCLLEQTQKRSALIQETIFP